MKTISERTTGLKSEQGFFSLHYDAQEGKLLLELPGIGQDFLYHCNPATGLGTPEFLLDRGQAGDYWLCSSRRVGPTVLIEQKNLDFRSLTREQARSVEESFACRILAALPVEAEEDGRVLVDVTAWLKADALMLPQRFSAQKLGKIRIDEARCSFFLERTHAFPRNTEVESLLTLQAEEPLQEAARKVFPEGASATLRQRHSFLALPEPGYEARWLDPRVGYFSVDFHDYAQAPGASLTQRLLARWRLEKSDPSLPLSRPKRPITFYLDPEIPEPFRAAVREGALWWNEAFRGAGFEGALEVLDLEAGQDPMDARFSTIFWVHRAERGWSLGWSAKDPRTGEILRAAVLLDSHRLRTCHEMWVSLVGAEPGGESARTEFTLRRVRLLAAHEMGHALGLTHNFLATEHDRASVMNYYSPRLRLLGDGLDLSDAYRAGVGPYDRWAIRFGYGAAAEAQAVLEDGLRQGHHLLADREARPLHTPDPRAHQYIDGPDPVAELRRLLPVRAFVLGRMGPRNLASGEPAFRLRSRFAYVYGLHRFALEASIKNIGGAFLSYACEGDGRLPVRRIEAAAQRRALDAILECLRPEALETPEALEAWLAPEPLYFEEPPDVFSTPCEPLFDPLEPARQLGRTVLRNLLDERRCSRLAEGNDLTLGELLSRLTRDFWPEELPARERHKALLRVIQHVYVEELFRLGQSKFPALRGAAEAALLEIRDELAGMGLGDLGMTAHFRAMLAEIERFLRRDYRWEALPAVAPLPAGAPLGASEGCCWG